MDPYEQEMVRADALAAEARGIRNRALSRRFYGGHSWVWHKTKKAPYSAKCEDCGSVVVYRGCQADELFRLCAAAPPCSGAKRLLSD